MGLGVKFRVWVYRVFTRVPLGFLRAWGCAAPMMLPRVSNVSRKGFTWRFMGSYKWGYKSPNMGYFVTPLITTHEPRSRGSRRLHGVPRFSRTLKQMIKGKRVCLGVWVHITAYWFIGRHGEAARGDVKIVIQTSMS